MNCLIADRTAAAVAAAAAADKQPANSQQQTANLPRFATFVVVVVQKTHELRARIWLQQKQLLHHDYDDDDD